MPAHAWHGFPAAREQVLARSLGPICVLVVCGLLVLGLQPFLRPRNTVSWLPAENGLQFGDNGTIWSTGMFPAAGPPQAAAGSLEIWMEPESSNASNTFLAFTTPGNPLQLSLHQYHSSLVLRREDPGRRPGVIGIDHVFQAGRPVFLSITSGARQSAMYVDGVLADRFPGFRLGEDFTGQLVVGTSPVEDESWAGRLRGLAIYARALTAEEVAQHYASWTRQGHPGLSGGERAVAVYLFDERAGRAIHSVIRPGIDLHIPERYALAHQLFLQPFWTEYKPTWSHWRDMLVNLVGFVPLGFVCGLYWSRVRPLKHAALVSTLLGLAVSLTIEVLQSYLPMRNSGTTDLFTNTLGTYLGYWLLATKGVQARLARILGAA